MKGSSATVSSRLLSREVFHLLRPFWRLVVLATVVGILSGLAATGLLARINQGLQRVALDGAFWASFAGLLFLSVAGTSLAGILNSLIGQKIIAALRKDIASRILRAPLDTIESYGSHRLLAILNNDIDTVSAFTFSFSGYAIALAVVSGGLIYLLWLSPLVFVLSACSLAFGLVLTLYSRRSWIKDYEGVRDAQDNLQKHYRAITEGAKELRINQARRAQVFDGQLSRAVDTIARLKSHAMRQFWLVDGISAGVFFLAIGLMLSGLHSLTDNHATLGAAVIILLYIKGPAEQLAGALPVMEQAHIAMLRLAGLCAAFAHPEPDISLAPPEDNEDSPPIGTLALRGVCYRFADKNGHPGFALGPIDLEIRAGEILFIVGENGSGKTTLIKVLLGLYAPARGGIYRDGRLVTEGERDHYRQLFTTVFADYYLFDELVAAGASADQARHYLEKLEIAHKVRVEDNAFTTTDLSTGQRKRLALVHAYLEHRPVIVFDEWAADQDPAFRQVFYTELLPDLKSRGKTIIIISHDDRYFGVADRVVHLHAGVIVSDRPGAIDQDGPRHAGDNR